jgi:hypothetical protein
LSHSQITSFPITQVLLPFESDLDCNNITSWRPSGVFCSQVCLLIMRRLAQTGTLQVSPGVKSHMLAVNSRGCSPNALYRLLSPQ